MRVNKYCKAARDLARTICNFMNLFYKKEAAGLFKMELLLSIRRIEFTGSKWELDD